MPKQRGYGSDAQLAAAFEVSYGVSPDDGYYKLSFKESSLGAEKPLGYDPLLGMGRDAQDPFYEAVTVDGSLTVPIDVRAIGFWLKGLFGAPTSTQVSTGKYSHVFKSGGALPSLSVEIGHKELGSYYLHSGVKLDNFSFDMARTGPVNATINVVAQGEKQATTALEDALDSFGLKRFNSGSGTIKLNGTQLANVTAGKFNFSNNLERVETIRSDGMIDGVDETSATADGSVDLRFSTDTSVQAAVTAETPVSLSYGFALSDDSGHSILFELPRVYLPRKKQEIKGPGGIQITYDWKAASDAAKGYMLQVTLINDQASY